MQRYIFVLALSIALSNAPLRARAADAVPKFDEKANCKAEVADSGGVGETLESCMRDEEEARRQLEPVWARFARQDKLDCIREASIDGTPSYVELQTCLEIASDKRTRLGNRQ